MNKQELLKYLMLLPSLLIFGSVWAQQGNDIVTLRNGSVYRGTIMEKIPTQHVMLKTLDGRVKIFPTDEVKSARMNVKAKVPNRALREPITPKAGYFNNTDFGLLFGVRPWGGIGVRPGVNMINGYQFDRFSLGAGVGMASFNSEHYVPVFLDSRVYLRKNDQTSPYLALQGGYAFGLTPVYNYDLINVDFAGEPPSNVRPKGLHGAAQIGLRKYTSQKFGINFSIGTRVQRAKTTYEQFFWTQDQYVPITVTEVTRMFRSEFRFGIFFN